MRILIIGGTGFIGPSVVKQLDGHDVTVLHRGKRHLEGVRTLHGDRQHLQQLAQGIVADVVIDMICSSEKDGNDLVGAFEGRAGRTVVLSSGDVYRAHDVMHRKDTGPLQPIPIREDDTLRSTRYPYRGVKFEAYEWATDDYDKILVEQAVAASPRLPATILRPPM